MAEPQTVQMDSLDIKAVMEQLGAMSGLDTARLQKLVDTAVAAGDDIIMPFHRNRENVPSDAKAIPAWAKQVVGMEKLGLTDADLEKLEAVRELKEEYENMPLASQVQTVADITSELYIKKRLGTHFPDVFIVGEESAGDAREAAKHSHKFYVDPLDGTKAFIDGQQHFGVLIGEVKDKQAQTGVCYFPHAEDRKIYVADSTQGIALYGEQQANGQWEFTLYQAKDVKQENKPATGIVVNEPFPEADERLGRLAESWKQAKIEPTKPAAATILDSARHGQLHMREDDKAFYWDLAAPAAFLKAMGAKFTGLGGIADYSFDEAARATEGDKTFPKAQGYMVTPPGVEPLRSMGKSEPQAMRSASR